MLGFEGKSSHLHVPEQLALVCWVRSSAILEHRYCPWVWVVDSNDTLSAWTVLFSTYATSCVSAFCTEADVELVVAGVDIEEE